MASAIIKACSTALHQDEVEALAASLGLPWLLVNEQNVVVAPLVSPYMAAALTWDVHRGAYCLPSNMKGMKVPISLDDTMHTFVFCHEEDETK